jgi:hypothetical protein
MRPGLEDHLVQEAVGMERAIDAADPLDADAYARLAEALRAGRRLADVAGAAREPREPSRTWRVRELGIVLDALLAVGATDAGELEVFLLMRAGRAGALRRARRAEQERRHKRRDYPLQERLNEILARRSPVDRLKLARGLLDLGLIDGYVIPDSTVASTRSVSHGRRRSGPPVATAAYGSLPWSTATPGSCCICTGPSTR